MRTVILAFLASLSFGFSVPAIADQSMTVGEACRRISARLASVSMDLCERSQLKLTGAVSHNDFPILMRSVPAASPSDKEEPIRVLLIGGIHGDELTSISVVFQWMELLDTPQARKLHWHIAPLVNPDGLFAKPAQRMNARGVDLNRNFPTPGWEHDSRTYWVKRTGRDPRRYPGDAPLSEPESRWLDEEMARFRPDVIISVHAPFGILDFDGPRTPPRKFGRLHLSQLGVYPGSLGNYGGVHKKVPVITIELPNASTMPPKAEMLRIWRDMLGWIERHGQGGPELIPVGGRPASETALIDH